MIGTLYDDETEDRKRPLLVECLGRVGTESRQTERVLITYDRGNILFILVLE